MIITQVFGYLNMLNTSAIPSGAFQYKYKYHISKIDAEFCNKRKLAILKTHHIKANLSPNSKNSLSSILPPTLVDLIKRMYKNQAPSITLAGGSIYWRGAESSEVKQCQLDDFALQC